MKETKYSISPGKKQSPHCFRSIGMTIGDIAMVKEEEKKHGKWNIGIISEIFKGRTNKRRVLE